MTRGCNPWGVGTEKSSNNQEICHYMARYQNLLHILKIKGIELQRGMLVKRDPLYLLSTTVEIPFKIAHWT